MSHEMDSTEVYNRSSTHRDVILPGGEERDFTLKFLSPDHLRLLLLLHNSPLLSLLTSYPLKLPPLGDVLHGVIPYNGPMPH